MFRRKSLAPRAPRGISASGLFAIERAHWALAVESIEQTGSVPETLVLIASDTAQFVQVATGGALSGVAGELREKVHEVSADAAIYYGFSPRTSRLSLYNYWHSASGRRIRVADAAAGDGSITVTERDMRKATGLHSWVEELFAPANLETDG